MNGLRNCAARFFWVGNVLAAAAIAMLACSFALAAEGETNLRPNVLFIAVDDLNDWVSVLGGHPLTRTPNFDRLAKSGTLFTNAYCAAPSCNPSRSAVLSGMAPYRSGLYDNMQKLRDVMPDAELLPHYFSRHGYWSAGSGKILHYVIDPQSWDAYFPAKEKDNPFPQTFNPKNRPLNLPRGGPWQYGETDWGALDISDEDYGGDWLVTKWCGEQLAKKHEKPFFLACGIYRPHEPWFVPKKYFEPFPLEKITPGPGYKADDLDDVPPEGQRIARNRYFDYIRQQNQWTNGIQAYLASIHYADAMLGRVLDALDEGPNRNNTIVVLWSDHGWHLGEKEHWQKYTLWRICDRVPLLVRVPAGCAPGLRDGTQASSICARTVGLVDLYRTLLDLCGLPEKAGIGGQSFVPLLKTPNAEWAHPALTHLAPKSYAVSTERHRYIHYSGGGEELYDIVADPYEWKNLAGDKSQATTIEALRAQAPKDPAAMHETQPGISTFVAEEQLPVVASKQPLPASKAAESAVTVLFQNQGTEPLLLFWIDQQGRPQPRGELAGASRKLVQTHAGQVWSFTDREKHAQGHVVVGSRSAKVIIND